LATEAEPPVTTPTSAKVATAKSGLGRIFYGPPDWLVTKFASRDRRAFGFWTLVFAAIGSLFLGNQVWWIAILSVVALIPNFSTETPVEEESGGASDEAP
jgi:hypothetical protein